MSLELNCMEMMCSIYVTFCMKPRRGRLILSDAFSTLAYPFPFLSSKGSDYLMYYSSKQRMHFIGFSFVNIFNLLITEWTRNHYNSFVFYRYKSLAKTDMYHNHCKPVKSRRSLALY